MELSDRLATLRDQRGYSLRQLRDRIEERTGDRIAVSYLSSLERVGGVPSMETLTRIAAGYDMTVRKLLEPVDEFDNELKLNLPPGLREFAEKRRDITDDQLVALSKVEFRGAQPETAAEWEQLYNMLGVLLGPKVKG